MVPTGSSSTEAAWIRTGATRHGLSPSSNMDHVAVTIKVESVNGKAHREGVNAMGRVDPEAGARGEVS